MPPPPSSSPPPPPPPPSSTPSAAEAPAAAVSWMESIVKPDPVLAARVNATAVEGQSAVDVAPPMLGERVLFFSLLFFSVEVEREAEKFEEEETHSFFFPSIGTKKRKTGVGAASDHVIIGGRLPSPMPGEEAAAASAAVSDLPGAGGASVMAGTGKAAEGNKNETLSLVSGAGVSASGDGDGGNSNERQQLAGGDGSSNPSSDQSVISYASGESIVFFSFSGFFIGRPRSRFFRTKKKQTLPDSSFLSSFSPK